MVYTIIPQGQCVTWEYDAISKTGLTHASNNNKLFESYAHHHSLNEILSLYYNLLVFFGNLLSSVFSNFSYDCSLCTLLKKCN